MGSFGKERHKLNDVKESQVVQRRRNAEDQETQLNGSLRPNSPCPAEPEQAICLQVSGRKQIGGWWPPRLACMCSYIMGGDSRADGGGLLKKIIFFH